MGLLIDLDLESFRTATHGSPQVMVYGLTHCKYLQFLYTLEHSIPPIVRKVFQCFLVGDSYNYSEIKERHRVTLEKRLIQQFKVEPLDKITDERQRDKKMCTRLVKNGLLNLVFENFLRKKQALEIIPFIFVMDVSDNKYPLNPKDIAINNIGSTNLVANSLLRRCYKLANEFPDPRIREVAAHTFRFVKLEEHNNIYFTKLKEPFWLEPSWKAAWDERKKRDTSYKLFQEFSWEKQLISAIEAIEKGDEKKDISVSFCRH